jgi:hypothetical protein
MRVGSGPSAVKRQSIASIKLRKSCGWVEDETMNTPLDLVFMAVMASFANVRK